MSDYSNKEGSTGYLKEGVFVPFKDQAEADNNGPVETETEKPAKKAAAKGE